ncbi:MAG: electron transfer flavoprotein subunit alpha/FixB family protein, partial [Firmicutes bacterium]|nr:electron transfer flavoprotein subunit alpha/FixB family protein [Bacillota bacterium]
MSKAIWVLAEHKDGHLSKVTLEMLSQAHRLSLESKAEISAILIGHKIDHLTELIKAYGANNIYVFDNADLEKYNIESYAGILSNLILKENPSILFMAATVHGKELSAKLAARLKTGLATDCFPQ